MNFNLHHSHELRTPLTSIKGWGETLAFAENDNEDEITRKGLQVIVHEAGRLEGFVEELLDFSRLQSGRMKLRLALRISLPSWTKPFLPSVSAPCAKGLS